MSEDKLNQFLHILGQARAITIPISLRMIHYHDTPPAKQSPQIRKDFNQVKLKQCFFVSILIHGSRYLDIFFFFSP